MSALARFFKASGAVVSGYDRTETALTLQLQAEGMSVHYVDDISLIDKDAELVVYTPAIPQQHQELNWLRDNKYPVYKRSDVLQWITQSLYAITVAGTHGKTTISTIIAYLMREAGGGCNAFLGGIAANYDSNYWGSPKNVAVIEADEYDRSFLKLHPDIAVLTAMDPDHLDIYGTTEEMERAFIQYTHNIKQGGTLVVKKGLHRASDLNQLNTITYSLTDTTADVHALNVRGADGGFVFDITGKGWKVDNVTLPIGGLHNVENVLAAFAAISLMDVDLEVARRSLQSFRGVHRRFEYVIKNSDTVFIDDYAHHPEELAALIRSAKMLFPGRRCVVSFQPHLFTRTRDLADGFAHSLDMADEVLLLDIYPARELPIEGVTAQMILDRMQLPEKRLVTKEELLQYAATHQPQLFITSGAGDIDKLVQPIKERLMK